MKYSLIKYFLITGIGILIFAVNSYSQDSQVRATAPSVVTQGQAFSYTLSGDFSGDVELPELKGMRYLGGPSTFVSQQSSFINGRMETTKTVTYTYTFMAQEEGELIIPPATVKSGRKEIKTNEVRITVVKSGAENSAANAGSSPEAPQARETVSFRQLPSKTTVWQGEQIVLETKIYTREALNISSFKAPGFDGFWRQDLEADNSSGKEVLNGSEYATQVFKRDLLTAQKSGEITIGPANIECMIRKKIARNRQSAFDDPFFNDSFFDRYENVPQAFTTNSPVIKVKSLPVGAPEGFNGAVGSFNLKVSIDKDQLKVNDAITLKVRISGNGNLDLLKPVQINFPPDLEVFDPKSVQNLKHSQNGTSGSLDYEYVIIPRHAGNFRIAPIVFSWFDPTVAKYKTTTSSEFNFTVDKSEGGDESYITSPLSSAISGQGGKEVVSLAGDIRFIRLTPPGLRQIGKTILWTPFFIASYVIPILLLLSLLVFRRERIRRNADFNAVRNRKARKLAEKRLRNASNLLKSDDNGFYDEILKAIWGYLSDKLGMNVSDLSREKTAKELEHKNLEPEVLNSLWTLLDDCEYARYASGTGGEGDKQKIYNDAISLISVLQEKISKI